MTTRIDLRSAKTPLDERLIIERVTHDKRGLEYANPTLRISGDYVGDANDFAFLCTLIKRMLTQIGDEYRDDNIGQAEGRDGSDQQTGTTATGTEIGD